jgi:hypothetical protein
MGIAKLWNEVCIAFNWTGYLCWKEACEKRKVNEGAHRLTAPIDFNHIVDKFENEERNAERQNDLHRQWWQ